MSMQVLSVVLRCWPEPDSGATRVQVVLVDTESEVQFATSSFLLRIMSDDQGRMKRCYIRHTASGREAYLQGSPNLGDLIRECLLVAAPALPTSGTDEPVRA